MIRSLLLFAVLSTNFAFAQSGKPIRMPVITGEVELHAPVKTPDVAPFTAGPEAKPVQISADTRKKLDDLAAKYVEVARTNYPLILRTLKAGGKLPEAVKITVTYRYKGVAAAAGSNIMVSAEYALNNPNDLGMIVHEMVHVVQGYPTYDPGWLVEGIADYVRWFHFEPKDKQPKLDPEKVTARDSYRTTGAFLYWASNRYGADLVPKLHAAFQANKYREDMFKEITGKSLTELEAEWKESLRKSN